ncbi:DinB family protein [Dactylosporangium sp. NPDC048998]|uniref:DinB family protein n=1 Tax=Dactylosporangium sp. NPDC048998 TaxID=3363976 RepID=UPI003715BE16
MRLDARREHGRLSNFAGEPKAAASCDDLGVGGWQALVRDLVHRTQRDVLDVLDGLDPALVDDVVQPGTNSIGWLLWHLTRSHDRNVSELQNREQLWLSEGWYARFGRAADPDETGYGHSPAQAASFRSPPASVLVGYHQAVVKMIDEYLRRAPDEDLDRLATSPTLGDTTTVHLRLVGVLVEGLEHVGQAALLRGVLQRRQEGASPKRDGP